MGGASKLTTSKAQPNICFYIEASELINMMMTKYNIYYERYSAAEYFICIYGIEIKYFYIVKHNTVKYMRNIIMVHIKYLELAGEKKKL